jgi:hypothetical protein
MFEFIKSSQLTLDDSLILAACLVFPGKPRTHTLVNDDIQNTNEIYKMCWELIFVSKSDKLPRILVDMSVLSFFRRHMTGKETNLLLSTSCHFTDNVLSSLNGDYYMRDIVKNYSNRVLADCGQKFKEQYECSKLDSEYLLKRYVSIMTHKPSIPDHYFLYNTTMSNKYYIILKESGIMPGDNMPPYRIPQKSKELFIGSRHVQQDMWNHPDYLKYYKRKDHINDKLCSAIRHICWMCTYFVPEKLTLDDLEKLTIYNIPQLFKYHDVGRIFKCPLMLINVLEDTDWFTDDIGELIKLRKTLELPCTCNVPEHNMLQLFFHDRKSPYCGSIMEFRDHNHTDYHLFMLIYKHYAPNVFIDWVCAIDDVSAYKCLNVSMISKAYEHNSTNIINYSMEMLKPCRKRSSSF